MNLSFSIMNYYRKTTPLAIRKFADGLMASSVFITTTSLYQQCTKVAFAAMVMGALGKILSNCFAEVEQEVKKDV